MENIENGIGTTVYNPRPPHKRIIFSGTTKKEKALRILNYKGALSDLLWFMDQPLDQFKYLQVIPQTGEKQGRRISQGIQITYHENTYELFFSKIDGFSGVGVPAEHGEFILIYNGIMVFCARFIGSDGNKHFTSNNVHLAKLSGWVEDLHKMASLELDARKLETKVHKQNQIRLNDINQTLLEKLKMRFARVEKKLAEEQAKLIDENFDLGDYD